jgi:hypothetical protein
MARVMHAMPATRPPPSGPVRMYVALATESHLPLPSAPSDQLSSSIYPRKRRKGAAPTLLIHA